MHLSNSEEFAEPSTLKELKEWSSSGGNLPELISRYEKEADCPGKWTKLGHCYALSRNYIQSIASYEKAIKCSEFATLDIWLGLGDVYFKNNQPVSAELAYKYAFELSGDAEIKTELEKQLARTYKTLKEYSRSADHYGSFLASGPLDAQTKSQVLCELASVRQAQDRNEEAVQLFNEALELTQQNFKVFEYMGWHHFLTGNYTQANANLQRALELAGDRCLEVGDIHYLIGRCHLAMGNCLESQGAIQRAIFKNPESYIYWCSMGILYALSTQAQDSFDCFVKACNVFPDSGIIWFNIGVLYEHCKQKQEAALAYQRAASIDCSNTVAIERKNMISTGSVNGDIPAFIHPTFEIQESPFSNSKPKVNEKLPDITQERPEEPLVKEEPVGQIPNVFEMIAKPTPASEAPPVPVQTVTPTPVPNHIQNPGLNLNQSQNPAQPQPQPHPHPHPQTPVQKPAAPEDGNTPAPTQPSSQTPPIGNGQVSMSQFTPGQLQALAQYQMMLMRQLASNPNGPLIAQWLMQMGNRNRDPEREATDVLASLVTETRERRSSNDSPSNKKHK